MLNPTKPELPPATPRTPQRGLLIVAAVLYGGCLLFLLWLALRS